MEFVQELSDCLLCWVWYRVTCYVFNTHLPLVSVDNNWAKFESKIATYCFNMNQKKSSESDLFLHYMYSR